MKHKKFIDLVSLIDINLTHRESLKILEKTDTLSGYDIFFIISLIIRNKFSGNLVIISENDDVSGVQFIKGNISKVDFSDETSSMGNIMIHDKLITSSQLKQFSQNIPENELDQILMENLKLQPAQIIQLLLKQSNHRLLKLMQIPNIRINFNLNEHKNQTLFLSDLNYLNILYNLIYRFFKNDLLKDYQEFYSTQNFSIYLSEQNLNVIKDFQFINEICQKLKNVTKQKITYEELITIIELGNNDSIKVVHFLILTGFILIHTSNSPLNVNAQKLEQDIEVNFLLNDLTNVKKYILAHKYYDALGIMNKYSGLMNSNDYVRFYFIWIKLHGAFYHNFILDISKISSEISKIDQAIVGFANYSYVLALLEACRKNSTESALYYNKAVSAEESFARFPILKKAKDAPVSIWDKIKKVVSS